MKKTLVIGANGQIGKLITHYLHKSDMPVRAMVRNRQNAQSLINLGVDVAEGNLEEDFESIFDGCDRVIFTAGSGGKTSAEQTLLVDLWGASKAIDIAATKKIQHFIMVSSRGADNPDNGPSAIKPYLVAKHFADNHLMHSTQSYTILRPGRLLDEKGTGLITTSAPIAPEAQVISRQDTAQAILYCLKNPSTIGKIYELYKGNKPISEAIC